MSQVIKATLVKPGSSNNEYEQAVHPVTDADLVYYDENTTVKEKIEQLAEEMEGMTYEKISINTFTATPSYVEKGNIITSIKFNFEFNRVPKTIQLKVGNNTYEISNTAESYTVSGLSIKTTTACVLTVYDNKNGYATKTINVAERRRYFYGVAESFTKLTDLTANILTSKDGSYTVNAGTGKHIYYCCPINSVNDNTVFNVGGFEGGFTLKGLTDLTTTYDNGTFNVSNNGTVKAVSGSNIKNTDSTSGSTYSTTQSYAIYESDNTGLGNITFKVS